MMNRKFSSVFLWPFFDLGVLFFLLFPGFSAMADEREVDPHALLQAVRLSQFQEGTVLEGTLRSGREQYPVTIRVTPQGIQYDLNKESFLLQFDTSKSTLSKLSASGTPSPLTPDELRTAIAQTDLTFEDLSLWFLYWENLEYQGTQIIGPRRTHQILARAPNRDSQYSGVVLWLDQQSGALVKMDGYNWDGKICKRFQVVRVKKIQDYWSLGQLRVETINPENEKVLSRTYMTID